MESEILYDVIAVSLADQTVRLMDGPMSLAAAERYVEIAVYRRGVDTEIFTEVPHGSYQTGDIYKGY